MGQGFQDHFSGHARDYARYRPGYPPALFDWLADAARRRELAWDCATGSGQAAVPLARHFARVVATDGSRAQLAAGQGAEGVRYLAALAEAAPLVDGCVDLVTVAQALHWFDHPRFFREARRVLAPGGLLAAWSYGLARVGDGLDGLLREFHDHVVGRHWPPQRRLVGAGIRDIPMPLQELPAPEFSVERDWSADDMLAYLGTWSAVRRARDAGESPMDWLAPRLRREWGGPRRVMWPLVLRVGVG